MDKELQDFADFARATHEGFQLLKAQVRAEHALRCSRRVQSFYFMGQDAARAGMPRLWPLDVVDDDAAADFCAAFFAGYDAACLDLPRPPKNSPFTP